MFAKMRSNLRVPACLFLLLVVCCTCLARSTVHDSPGVCDENDVSVDSVYVSYDVKSEKFSLRDVMDAQTVAYARYSNCINTTGFAYLTVSTVNDYTYVLNSSIQAYAAGLAEGYITRGLIDLHFQNTMTGLCDGKSAQCQGVERFLRRNLDWVFKMVEENPDDNYWYQVRLFYEQLRGIQDGFDVKPGRITMEVENVFGLFLLTHMDDLEDVWTSLYGRNSTQQDSDHCSVLIKVLQGQDGVKDVLMAHDTWSSYNTMLRILKRYDFYLHKVPTASAPAIGSSMTLSGYPGTLVSTDDFYVLASSLVVTETTNPVLNDALYKLIRPESVLESVRITVANRLAEHGSDWSNTFSRYNSGTYNNQWMVIDLKQYDPFFRQVLPGFLTVLEQIPGKIHSEDKTKQLLETSYWSSYNIPYYPDIFKASGLPDMVAKYGDYFSHDNCPRAKIFERDQSKVTDIDSLTRLMRYNDYQHDPLSKCNCTPPYSATNAISARNDLNPVSGTYPFPQLGFRLEGGIDMKLTSLNIAMDTLTFMAISGPTFDPLPPFQWSKAVNGSSTLHLGMPDVFNFGPVWFNGTFG
ncbi:putative phospholipase B-like 2 isoform X2 [Littorina saxatilis]|uniref:Phospholipase B-like n=1 Tax=Littorina saxatilis TaxID=31220 RepID=A0AAN9FWG2_9CAEN